MNELNKKINGLLEAIASKMNLSRSEVAKRLPVLDDLTISILEDSLKEKQNEGNEDEFIKCSVNALLNLKQITHPDWEECFRGQRFKDVCNDIKSGVTFAFYWKDGFLCWER